MRSKVNAQLQLDFRPSNLELTNGYYAKYQALSKLLDANPEITDLVHAELRVPLKYALTKGGRGADHRYSSDTVLRLLICQTVEGVSLRQIVIRVDDSHLLRRFTRLYYGPMIDFTTLDKLRNSIRPSTWRKINELLARHAVRAGQIESDSLRLDTTAVETNIHWPTDSTLLWDVYRVLARLLRHLRRLAPKVMGKRRLHPQRIKRLQVKISRLAGFRGKKRPSLKPFYKDLISRVETILQLSEEVSQRLQRSAQLRGRDRKHSPLLEALQLRLDHFTRLGRHVVMQARVRVLEEGVVPNDQKVFSIFEPHTELLVRGKAGRAVEFGHMIHLEQVRQKFITHYESFVRRPVEHALLAPAIDRHRRLFGTYPKRVAADQGFAVENTEAQRLASKVEVLAIRRRGRPSDIESARQDDPAFRHAQRFRAGVEGTISFLKRVLGLDRCVNRGWRSFAATIGLTIFAHNLIVLARC